MCSPSQYTFISILSYIIYKEREKERERANEKKGRNWSSDIRHLIAQNPKTDKSSELLQVYL